LSSWILSLNLKIKFAIWAVSGYIVFILLSTPTRGVAKRQQVAVMALAIKIKSKTLDAEIAPCAAKCTFMLMASRVRIRDRKAGKQGRRLPKLLNGTFKSGLGGV